MEQDATYIILLLLLANTYVIHGYKSAQSDCCPDFWTRVGNSCYKVSPGPMSWFDAEQYCSQEGGYLIEIRDHKEQASLHRFLQSDIFYWIGLTDLAEEGKHVWQTDYQETKFTFWKKDQPGSIKEDCVHTWDNFQWNDRRCEETAVLGSVIGPLGPIHALCEKDIVH